MGRGRRPWGYDVGVSSAFVPAVGRGLAGRSLLGHPKEGSRCAVTFLPSPHWRRSSPPRRSWSPPPPQEDTGHPLVGAWIFVATGDPTVEPDLVMFGADGNVLIAFPGGLALGTWSPSGAITGDLTAVWPHPDESGYLGIGMARGSFEVSADGETLTGAFTNEYPTGQGGTTGQLGPIEVTATRVALEPMSTPITPTPEAAPAPGASPSE